MTHTLKRWLRRWLLVALGLVALELATLAVMGYVCYQRGRESAAPQILDAYDQARACAEGWNKTTAILERTTKNLNKASDSLEKSTASLEQCLRASCCTRVRVEVVP